jgi:hypothetical protein
MRHLGCRRTRAAAFRPLVSLGRKIMNRYAPLLADTEAEIDAFASGPHGAQCDAGWYSDIKDLVRKVAAASTDPEVERYLDMLCWCIVDSGLFGK